MISTSSAPSPIRRDGPSGLADVLDVLLDKGLVIDAFVRVSLVGIELLTVDARIVLASVDTYLRFAEAVNRLDLNATRGSETLPELFRHGAEGKTRKALGGGRGDASGGDEGEGQGEEKGDGEGGEGKDEDGGDGGDGGGILGAVGKAVSKVRERGKWD